MAITAVIPVRAGSTRVKNKNIKKFADSSLLEIKIQQLKRIQEIDEIIVSSDSEKMLEVANSYGVTAKWRPKEYCDEKTRTFNEVVQYIADKDVSTDVMMWVPCVCPMLSSSRILQGIELFKKIETGELKKDSVITATLFKEYLFDENGPKNFDAQNHVISQNLPNWHYRTNGFYIARTEDMVKWRYVHGPNPYLCEINKFEAIDIDDEYDFMMAELLYNYMKGKGEII